MSTFERIGDDPILEHFKSIAKRPETVGELDAILTDFARRIGGGEYSPRIAAEWMLEDLAGRNEAWQDALDKAWQAEEAA